MKPSLMLVFIALIGFRIAGATGVKVDLTAQIEELALADRIESAHIGEGGEASHVYQVFEALAAQVDGIESVRLTRHKSPVVRGYFARHTAENFPNQAAALAPVFLDVTKVKSINGCKVHEQTVAEYFVWGLCSAKPSVALQKVTLEAAQNEAVAASVRGKALECLAAKGYAPAEGVALMWLQHSNRELNLSALSTLSLLKAKNHWKEISVFTQNSLADLRAKAADVLGEFNIPEAEPILAKLSGDSDRYVRLTVATYYVRLTNAKKEVINRLAHDSDAQVRKQIEKEIKERKLFCVNKKC